MGKWKKPSAGLVELFERVLPLDPRVAPRILFGFPAAFANGNLFAGLFEESMMLRLAEADRKRLVAEGGTPFDPMGKGSAMGEYVVVPEAMLEDGRALRTWVDRSLDYVLTLAPKLPKKKAPAKRRKKG